MPSTRPSTRPFTLPPDTPAAVRPRGRRISQRVASIAESTTLAIDARAKQKKADGRPIILYGTGEPDFPTPGHIVAAAETACADPRYHHYTPSAGLPELREAIADKTVRDSGLNVSPAQVVVTNGGKQALYNSFAALLDPADEVLLPTPHWTTYPESIRLAGGTPVEVATDKTTYRTSVDQLEAARTARTRALVFVSPSNPTGAVHSAEQTTAIGRWALEHGIWVVTDEIYEHLRYGSAAAGRYASMPVLVPELAEQTVVVNGVAKTYAMTGWRVGWTIAPLDISAAMISLQSHSTSNVANVSQAAALAALTGPQDEVATMRAAFDRRRLTMLGMLNEIDGVICPEPLGAFYCFPSVSGLLGRSYGGKRPQTSAELAELALEQIEIAVIPGEAFGTPGYLRLSYALGDDDLVEGLDRLQRLVAASTP